MTLVRFICLLLPVLGSGDDWRALVEEALDQVTELDIENRPIIEAFDTVVQNTGVQVSIAQETLDLLPYGPNTRLNAHIHNMTLREGLTQMAAPLGLRFEIGQRSLELVPASPLARLGRRATWEELDSLAALGQLELSHDSAQVDALANRFQFQVGEPDPWPLLRQAIVGAGAGRGDEVLTLACDALGWTWYPSGKHIVVVRKVDQQLRQVISLRQTGRHLTDVLQAIAGQAGLTIRCDPGAIAALPPQTSSNFSLYVENKSVADTLELVSATTGLGFEVLPDAVVFYNPSEQAGQAAQPAAGELSRPRDPYVGRISLPPGPDGISIELVIRESDLTPEVNELRLRHLKRANQAIKDALLRLEGSSGR